MGVYQWIKDTVFPQKEKLDDEYYALEKQLEKQVKEYKQHQKEKAEKINKEKENLTFEDVLDFLPKHDVLNASVHISDTNCIIFQNNQKTVVIDKEKYRGCIIRGQLFQDVNNNKFPSLQVNIFFQSPDVPHPNTPEEIPQVVFNVCPK